jgi:hypothetical protein
MVFRVVEFQMMLACQIQCRSCASVNPRPWWVQTRCLAVIFLVLVAICWGAVVVVVAAAGREDCGMVRVSAARGVCRRAGHGLCH